MITRDDAEKYLGQLGDIMQAIEAKHEQVARLKELATKTTSTLKDVVVFGSGNNGFDDAVVKWLSIETSVYTEIYQLETVRDDISERLSNMRAESSLLVNVLELRFLNRLGWEEVAGRLGYGLSRIYDLRGRALDMFINYMDEK